MSTRFILVRHGETKWNQENIFRGQTDIPLNENGLKQAELTGKALSLLSFAKIYASPLLRARQTAEAIAKFQSTRQEVITDNGLIDPLFGSWQGLRAEEVQARFPQEYQLWLNYPHKLTFPGGESLEIVRERAWNFLLGLLPKHQNELLCLVSHRVVVRLLLLAALGLNSSKFWNIQQGTCALNMLIYEENRGFIIHSVNETCHLQPWSRTASSTPPPNQGQSRQKS